MLSSEPRSVFVIFQAFLALIVYAVHECTLTLPTMTLFCYEYVVGTPDHEQNLPDCTYSWEAHRIIGSHTLGETVNTSGTSQEALA